MLSSKVNFPENLNILPSVDPKGELEHISGYEAQRQAIEKYGIAGRIWEAAYLLSIYVDPPKNIEFDTPFLTDPSGRPRTILELGSGAGMTSSRMAENLNVQDMLIVTDLPEVYFPELLAPLLRSLLQVTSPPFSSPSSTDLDVTVVISYKIRSLSKETPFWAAFGLWFTFEPVLAHESSVKPHWQRFGSSSGDVAFIFIAHRRPESLTWHVPESDTDLLVGRGAMGNNSAKADDTFETLLLMTLEE
ncbi:hypothetical protein H0H81_007276 [Sphagnurus paluster]|uniref:Uncharacterized protein n=1 Tax=Sphagnurus paluster TaxID=117069 RepID=A0A9P7FXI3_9AGAR|nr:hypothetical protein H0H81_007276 [Sphagnurus paluster]